MMLPGGGLLPAQSGSPHPRRGQAILEYLLLFGLVAAAIVGMQVYAKRGIQAALKVAADDLSPVPGDVDGEAAQIDGMRQEAGESVVLGPGGIQRRVEPSRVAARDSSVTTTEQSRIRTGATASGGAFTDYGAGAVTVTRGTGSTSVVSELK